MTRLILKGLLFFTLSAGTLLAQDACLSAELEIRGDYLYMEGEPFFIRGVGYSPWRPGQWPGSDKVDIKIIEHDLKMIKEAGFNTIRSWAALDQEVLKLAGEYDLYVIQGIWVDPHHNFADNKWQDIEIKRLESIVGYTKAYPNVLMYMVMTEPTTRAILHAGIEETEGFFKRIVDTIRKIDKRPVSMDSWIPAGFLDHSMWDIVTFNVFMFTPDSINRVLGFEDYVRFIKTNYAKGRPLLIGETGGFSVSDKSEGMLGFGGNTEEEQSKGNINSILTSFKAGAAGACVVSWIDTWHYPKDANVHDDEQWEWAGIIAMEDKKDPYGRPRLVYHNLKKFNSEYKPKGERSPQFTDDAQLIIRPAKEVFSPSDKIEVNIRVLREGKPVINKIVDYGFFIQEGWKDHKASIMTNSNGEATVTCDLSVDPHTGYVIFSASFKDNIYKVSDIRFLKVHFKK
jgi:hypothetical protein